MGVINPLPDEWLLRKTDHLKNGFGFSDRLETFWEAELEHQLPPYQKSGRSVNPNPFFK